MSQVVVDGRAYDVPESFTYREMSLIKKISGLRGGEIPEGLEKGDTDLIVAIAVISMRRSGHDVDENFVLDLNADAITIQGDEGDDVDPPVPAGADGADESA